MLLILYASYVDYYTQNEDWSARVQPGEGRASILKLTRRSTRLFFDRKACGYYCSTQQYEKALGKIDKAAASVKSAFVGQDYYGIFPLKAFSFCTNSGVMPEAADHCRSIIL